MVVVKNTSSFGDRLPGVKISGISHILAKELARQGKINLKRGNLFVNEIVMYIVLFY